MSLSKSLVDFSPRRSGAERMAIDKRRRGRHRKRVDWLPKILLYVRTGAFGQGWLIRRLFEV